ncbi:AraC family transcriptional regulator [Burkholderiaceae bacterium DAT-1]|nr:AraC family transcriptional regulator [Burkholderiaceae bacterium DAT-1]
MLNFPVIHPTYIRLLCHVLRERGVALAPVLAAGGLAEGELGQRRLPVGLASTVALVAAAEQAADCPWLGLIFGRALPLTAHGPIGYAAVASPDARRMLEVIQRYGGMRMPVLSFELMPDEGGVRLLVHERMSLGPLRRFLLDGVVAAFCRLFESNLGGTLAGVTLAIPWSQPDWLDEYEQAAAGASIIWSAPVLSWRFPAAFLLRPCLMSDETAAVDMHVQQHIESELPLSARIAARLGSAETGYPALDDMAASLHLSSRTVIRRLKAEGCTYQDLLDESRKARAEWWLRTTQLAVDVIADRLGFVDTSNFSRTFRRWFGMTPGEMRKGDGLSPMSSTASSTAQPRG